MRWVVRIGSDGRIEVESVRNRRRQLQLVRDCRGLAARKSQNSDCYSKNEIFATRSFLASTRSGKKRVLRLR